MNFDANEVFSYLHYATCYMQQSCYYNCQHWTLNLKVLKVTNNGHIEGINYVKACFATCCCIWDACTSINQTFALRLEIKAI